MEGCGDISGGCSAGGAIGSIIVGAGATLRAAFFLGLAFFFLAIRLAFFFTPFLAFRFLAKQLHRRIDEVEPVLNLA